MKKKMTPYELDVQAREWSEGYRKEYEKNQMFEFIKYLCTMIVVIGAAGMTGFILAHMIH